MKTNLLSCLILSFFILSFSSCNPKKALEDKINESIAEEIVGAGLGTNVETSNLTNAENANAEVDIKLNGTALNFANAKPIFTIAKEKNDDLAFAATISESEGNEQRMLQIAFFGKSNLFKSPLTAIITTEDKENQVKAIFSVMKISETGMEAKMTNSGTVKIISFSEQEVILEIDAKGEEMTESKTPFTLTGRIVCKYPMATYMGLKKGDIF